MKKDYEIVGAFDYNGNKLLVVKINGNAHVMTVNELHGWYGRLYLEKWKRSA